MTTSSDDGDTTSTALRWRYTNDLVAGFYLCTFVALVALDSYQFVRLGVVPETVRGVWLAIAGIAAAWVFGADAVRAWRGS
jgi:hypothetical protein